jgi:hypothetical protein
MPDQTPPMCRAYAIRDNLRLTPEEHKVLEAEIDAFSHDLRLYLRIRGILTKDQLSPLDCEP